MILLQDPGSGIFFVEIILNFHPNHVLNVRIPWYLGYFTLNPEWKNVRILNWDEKIYGPRIKHLGSATLELKIPAQHYFFLHFLCIRTTGTNTGTHWTAI
jgi:hypothetical protein